MYDFLSTTCRAIRYCAAIVGFLVSAALVSYGGYIRAIGEDDGAEDDVMLALGGIMAIQACIIMAIHGIGDRLISNMMKTMERQIDRLEGCNRELEQELVRFNTINENFSNANKEFRAQLASHKRENATLHASLEKLSVECDNLRDHAARLKSAQEAAEREVLQLRDVAAEENIQLHQMREMCRQQRETIAKMTAQLKDLNQLQRKSVQMIQMLTLYGDECKTLGVSLKDVAGELKQTDESLGLTAQELQVQLVALQTVTQELKRVAVDRGGPVITDDELQ